MVCRLSAANSRENSYAIMRAVRKAHFEAGIQGHSRPSLLVSAEIQNGVLSSCTIMSLYFEHVRVK